MTSLSEEVQVRCSFDGCDASIVDRVVLALVDQMCAEVDIDIALLDALEFPLGECLVALHEFDVRSVTVRLDGQILHTEIELAHPLPDGGLQLGESTDVVESFFEVRPSSDTASVSLVGRLG